MMNDPAKVRLTLTPQAAIAVEPDRKLSAAQQTATAMVAAWRGLPVGVRLMLTALVVLKVRRATGPFLPDVETMGVLDE